MPSLSGVAGVKAGALDRRITILRNGEPTDNGIEVVPGALGVLATRWASWKPANGREVFENAGREAKAGGTFWLRSDTVTRQISAIDKVAFDGRVYDVLAVQELGRREGVELIVAADDEAAAVDLSGLSAIPAALGPHTGWAAYTHTGGPQAIAADVQTALANNAGSRIEAQKPLDVVDLYDGTVVTGRNGDSIMVGVEFSFTPSDGAASVLAVTIDIGGTIGQIYTEEFPITNGAEVPHNISYHPPAYTLGTWQANGGTVKVRADGPGMITETRFVIHRLHKAR